MKLIALINSCEQYSPDSWEDKPIIVEITPETTVADLIKWHNKHQNRNMVGQIHIMQIEETSKLTEAQ